ncbi:MAG: NfeD family protein [Bacteriovoracaceae bacterium]|nr:NfeD family protein [Bacteriovoracaceae bacterium]
MSLMIHTETMAWLILAGIFFLLEFVIPGAIVSFLGLSSLIIAGLVHFGYTDNLLVTVTYWMILSIIFIVFFRGFILRLLPGDSRVDSTDEDEFENGAKVTVLETVDGKNQGRVRYRESSWEALSEQEIQVGEVARIVGREGKKLFIKKD